MVDWNSVTWGEISTLRYGKALRDYRGDDGEVRVWGTNGPIGWTTEGPLGIGPTPIIGRKGAYRGVHLAKGAFWVIDTAYWLELSKEVDPLWAFNRLLLEDINSLDSGSAIPSLTRSHFDALGTLLPPLPEQRRIAGVLGALDDLIETNEQLISDLDELSMSLFLDTWDGTSWCEIQDLGKLTMGQSPPGSALSDEQDGLPFYQGVRDFGSRFPTQRIFTKDSKRQVREGAILIAVRAPVGEINVALTEVSIGRGLAGLEATAPAIALRALRATAETWGAHQGTGTVFSSINGNELKKARVPLVKDDSLSSMLTVLDMQFKELFLENQQLRRTRVGLLPLLMSGKIRVREAEELVKELVG
ncbi:restriction endonuclease subunit S [Leucobacter sp. W1478]|uniref:restriction endonuclease subunit S n=1 Tax=Leucobacter sp. W1478 TaxID=3439065 RepID=UPI003F3E44D1